LFLTHIFLRIRDEAFLAADRAEIIGTAFILCGGLCSLGSDLHTAYRIPDRLTIFISHNIDVLLSILYNVRFFAAVTGAL
jgi:hypothetical protein